MAMGRFVVTMLFGLVLMAPVAHAKDDEDNQDGDPDTSDSTQYEQDEKDAEHLADQATQEVSGPQLPPREQFLQKPFPGPAKAPAPAEPSKASVKVDAKNAKEAASVAKQAAKVANQVAEHSVKVTGHAKKALTHALGALHDARTESAGLGKHQKESLKKAEAQLREANKQAEFGKLKKVKDVKEQQRERMEGDLARGGRMVGNKTEREHMREDIEEMRKTLKEKNIDDPEINKDLDELEADINNSKGLLDDESKAELERLRQIVDSLEAQPKDAKQEQKERMEGDLARGGRMVGDKTEREHMREDIEEIREMLRQKNIKDPEIEKDLDDLEDKINNSKGLLDAESKAELKRLRKLVDSLEANPERSALESSDAVPVRDKSFDIDTAMPYGDLEPFGREDTAQELTESSISQSDEMVDQLERAEVAEEKRSVFRALTRLRGAAITSFDGVARSQTGNIDEYNKINKWRGTHPLHHLADEESDVSKWAFPDNAD